MKKRNAFFKQPTPPKTPAQIRREQARLYSKQQRKNPKPKPQSKPNGKTKAKKLNDEFDFAEGILKAGSDKIAKYLVPMVYEMSGTTDITPGMDNQYFTVDDDYDGDMNKLFQHITFKEIPNNPDIQRFVEKIEEDPHMSKEQYDEYSQQWHAQSYNTLANKLTLSNYEILEQIMNSSSAWQIAKRGALDSDQVLERWLELYEALNEAQNSDSGILDWAIQQIENGKHTLNWLINAIDDEIKLMLAGKYSNRRKVHY